MEPFTIITIAITNELHHQLMWSQLKECWLTCVAVFVCCLLVLRHVQIKMICLSGQRCIKDEFISLRRDELSQERRVEAEQRTFSKQRAGACRRRPWRIHGSELSVSSSGLYLNAVCHSYVGWRTSGTVTLINTCSRVSVKSEFSDKMWGPASPSRTVIKGGNDTGSWD